MLIKRQCKPEQWSGRAAISTMMVREYLKRCPVKRKFNHSKSNIMETYTYIATPIPSSRDFRQRDVDHEAMEAEAMK